MATTAPLRRSTVTRSCLLLVVQDLHFARGRSAGAGQRADRTAFVRGLEGLNSRAYWKFESIPLQRRACKLSVPKRRSEDRREAVADRNRLRRRRDGGRGVIAASGCSRASDVPGANASPSRSV